MKKKTLLIYLIVFILSIQIVSAKELIVAFGDYNAKPYAFIKDNHLTKGIIKDIMDQIGNELNLKIKYMRLPRKRVSSFLLEGKVHIRLISNPNWFKNPKQFHWSKPLFNEKDYFVISTKNTHKIRRIRDLKAKRLGTILGYHYSILENNSKLQILREDTRTLEGNFKKLDLGRIDVLIDSDILIHYYIKEQYTQHKFRILQEVASSHSIHAMYSKLNLPISYKKIDAAFIKLKENGTIQKILDKYK